jgi:RNA polymerase subunit RPABC4/transcription elongation factor Spt4
MFFLIAGIQQKTKVVDSAQRLCPICGLPQACLKRTDHYLSIFFIPLFPVKRGEVFLVCKNCERLQSRQGQEYDAGFREAARRCASCGRVIERSFSFCPDCGRKV